MTPDRQHFRMLAQMWGLKNAILFGKPERAARWFAVSARYADEQSEA